MIKDLNDIIKAAANAEKVTISVAVAQDEEVLEALQGAYENNLGDAVLVGDAGAIKPMAEKIGLPSDIRIIDEKDDLKAASIAVGLIVKGEADVLMKGKLNTSDYVRAALNKENGLRCGKILSLMVANEVPGQDKLVFITDGGVNIAPNYEQKQNILINAIEALNLIGFDKPKVAVLAANERVNPKDTVSVECKALADMGANGELPPCIIEGPIALDVATSKEAAQIKGIESKIAGETDLFVVPDIVSGNLLGKSLIQFTGATNCGVVLGATHPMVLTSRSDTSRSKLCSIAMACLIASNKKTKNK